MKRCPQCRRDYTDETLNFCLDDGTALVDGSVSMDEPPTAILPEPRAANSSDVNEGDGKARPFSAHRAAEPQGIHGSEI